MATYDIYAILSDVNVLVAESNDMDHGQDLADRMIAEFNIQPMAVATLNRGEHTLRGTIVKLSTYLKGN